MTTPPNTQELSGPQTTVSTIPTKKVSFPMTDWQAALGSYLVLLWMAEIPDLAPVAVAIAWGTAIIYVIATNPLKSKSAQPVGNQETGHPTAQGAV